MMKKRFCCGGLCHTGGEKDCPITNNFAGPHLCILCLAVALPTGLMIFSTWKFFTTLGSAAPPMHILGIAGGWFMTIVTFALMYCTAYTDPGMHSFDFLYNASYWQITDITV